MRSAIELDDQACSLAEEVDDVRTQWLLASKFRAVESAGANQSPQRLFSGRC